MSDEREPEADVAEARDEERLASRRVAAASVSNQKPMSRYDASPMTSQHMYMSSQPFGEHDAEHRGGEQRDRAVVPAEALVVVHVADRVDLHEQAHERDDDEHERRRADRSSTPTSIDDVADVQPRHRRLEARAPRDHRPQDRQRRGEDDAHRGDAEAGATIPRQLAPGREMTANAASGSSGSTQA